MPKWYEQYIAAIPDGANLVRSKGLPGAVRGFFRDADGIGGHADLIPVDLRKPAAGLVALGIAVGVLGTYAAMKNAPHIKAWWSDIVVPTAQSTISTITRRDHAPHEAGTSMLSKEALEDFSSEIDVALEDTRANMSNAQAQQHFLEILMAASIIADRMRALANARIEDEDLPELASAMDKLTTQDVTDTINRMLESNSSLLDDETSAIFSEIFGGGQIQEGVYVPLSNEGITEALSLPGREIPLPQEPASLDGADPEYGSSEPGLTH